MGYLPALRLVRRHEKGIYGWWASRARTIHALWGSQPRAQINSGRILAWKDSMHPRG